VSNATPSPANPPSAVDLLCLLHDGDDRCGCLRYALSLALEAREIDEVYATEDEVARILTDCLATHPAGAAARKRGFRTGAGV
jgi:hypothetical protein